MNKSLAVKARRYGQLVAKAEREFPNGSAYIHPTFGRVIFMPDPLGNFPPPAVFGEATRRLFVDRERSLQWAKGWAGIMSKEDRVKRESAVDKAAKAALKRLRGKKNGK